MFNEMSTKKKKIEWSYDSSKNEWSFLDDWVNEGKPNTFVVRGFFINPHGKITKNETGDVPYVVTDGYNIRLPLWYVKMANMILDNEEYISGINQGLCGARITQYEDSFGKTRNKIMLYDIEN